MTYLDRIPWWMVAIACVTLGLAPFLPEPHIWEKLKMIATGALTRPIDIFDFAYHGVPWGIALAKLARLRTGQR